MFASQMYLLIYFVPLALIVLFYVRSKKKREKKNIDIQNEEFDAGLIEPPSLHPLIDPAKCFGCNACVEACPEKNVLGVVNGKAQLIAPSNCIGHGACSDACPFEAITLVFGTEKRGMDIPTLKPDFETSVPGIYIAGELGGMGLIRNAITQGTQAMETIAKAQARRKNRDTDILDVIIVGAGPAGFAASLAAIEQGLHFITLEQETFGGTVSHYPRGKLVMTRPVNLPLIGQMKFTDTTKEELLEFLKSAKQKASLKINYSERVEKIEKEGPHFSVTTLNKVYKTHTVLLAIGRRGTPRTLGVPGEERSKVVYRMIDPEQYTSEHVLIVGGGDSALEAAASIAEISKAKVTLSYRGDAFNRAKKTNRERVEQAGKTGRLDVLMESNVKEIFEKEVLLDQKGQELRISNDSIIVCAGGILPTGFLKEIGIEVETKHGTA